jgi:hypothetical protein
LERIIDLFKSVADGLVEDAMDDLSTNWNTGDNTGRNLDGINNILPTSLTGNDHGGITYTGNTFWQPEIVAGSAGPNSSWLTDRLERTQSTILACMRGSGRNSPTWATTDKATWSELDQAVVANERYDLRPSGDGRGAGGSAEKPLLIHGLPHHWDSDAQADVIRYYNKHDIVLASMHDESEGLWAMKRDDNPTHFFMRALAIWFLGRTIVRNPRNFAILNTGA